MASQQRQAFGFLSRSTPSNRGGAPSRPLPAPVQPPSRPLPPLSSFNPLAPWLSTEYYEDALSGFNQYDPALWLPTMKYEAGAFMLGPWLFITIGSAIATYYFLVINPDHKDWVSMPLDAHIVMGGALSFLVVMRTDASMNRWWEARCSWDTIINCCNSIGAQTAPALRNREATEMVLMQLMAFVVALKADLRDNKIAQEEVGARMDWEFVRHLNRSCNMPLQALKALSETVRLNLPPDTGDTKGLGSAIYDEVSEQIRVINHAVGACKKIKTTPMTFGYVATLRSFLILWLVSLPLALIGEFEWMGVPALSFISFLFLNVEQMAVEIEQPFGDDANDLPIESYIMELEKTLLEMTPGYSPPDDDEGGDGESGEMPSTLALPPPKSMQGNGMAPAPPAPGGTNLEQRLAVLEAMWHRESSVQAQQIQALTAELEGTRSSTGTPGGMLAQQEHWARISPDWRQRTNGRLV